MVDTNAYFGRPGNLITLIIPRGGLDATRDRPTSTFDLGDGGTRVDKLVNGARTYKLNYNGLTRDAFATLQAFAEGHEGPGPFVFLDPGQRNMLTANQSGATSVYNDTTNFSVAGSGCTIASDTTYTDAGPRILRWNFNNSSPASAGVSGSQPSSAFSYGIPVKSSRALVFSFQARGGGSDAIVTLTPQLKWYDSTGTLLSTTSGSTVTTASGSWSTAATSFVTGTPPASAVYVNWTISASAASVSSGAIVYIRRLQLEEGSTPGTWYPGTGVWPVVILSLADSWDAYFTDLRDRPAFVLQEDTS